MLSLPLPRIREGPHKVGQGQGLRLAAREDGLDDIRGQLCYADGFGDIAVVEFFAFCQFHDR